jgi:hypothetical protein
MKRIVLTVIAAMGLLPVFAQPCVPDTTIKTAGIYPINGTSTGFEVFMPPAMVNVPYNEVIQLLIPADTIIDTMGFQIPAQVLNMRIIDFAGLPPSMAFDCSDDSCSWAGAENGCAVFHGTPSWPEVGTYDVDILVYGTVSAGILGALSDTIVFKMHIDVAPAQGIDQFLASQSVKLQPNPITDKALLTFDAHTDKDFKLRLINLTGQTVYSQTGNAIRGKNEVVISRNNLPAGIYFYSLEMDVNSHIGRFIIGQ